MKKKKINAYLSCMFIFFVHLISYLIIVYRKLTFANQNISFIVVLSFIPKNWLKFLFDIQSTQNLSKELFKEALDKIKSTFRALGYLSHIISKTINNTISKCKNLLNKDQVSALYI